MDDCRGQAAGRREVGQASAATFEAVALDVPRTHDSNRAGGGMSWVRKSVGPREVDTNAPDSLGAAILLLMSDLAELTEQIRAFSEERDWTQFHDPKSLALALVGEVGELAELSAVASGWRRPPSRSRRSHCGSGWPRRCRTY